MNRRTSWPLCLMLLGGCFGSVGDLPEPETHRPEPVVCDDERASPEIPPETVPGCQSHAECTEGANGRCLRGRADNYCTYDDCFQDSDCDGSCVCSGANYCAGGGCQVDADCGAGGWCSPTLGGCGPFGGIVGYECHTPEDECIDASDCNGTDASAYCKFAPEAGHWVCDNVQCAG